jgi:GNAT superfamily N-acetyltransferase
VTITATIEQMPNSWESQETQHPKRGRPGITYTVNHAEGAPIDCLLHYSRKGTLTGILYHYPQDIPPWEKAGAVNTFVHPRRRRRGIGKALTLEAFRRGWVDPAIQNYTPEGAACMNAVLEELGRVESSPTRQDRT